MGEKLDAAVEIDVARDVILDRLTTRRTCAGCGEIYNVKSLCSIIPMIKSSDTKSPAFIAACACLPSSVPAATAPRKISPVEI
jgi:adenylate kinase family enzyme